MFIAKLINLPPYTYRCHNSMRFSKSHFVLNTTIRLKYFLERPGKLSKLYCINQLQTCLRLIIIIIIIIIKHTVTMIFIIHLISLFHHHFLFCSSSLNFFISFPSLTSASVCGITHFLITIDTTESSILVYPRSVIHFFNSSFFK